MKNIIVTFSTELSTSEINKILETGRFMFIRDGKHFEEFEDVDWEIAS